MRAGSTGQIRILSNTNALTEFLPEALSAFLAGTRRSSIDLEERLSDEIVGLIAEGVGDIGIVAGTVDTGRLETYPFRSDRFVLVVPQGHPLAATAEHLPSPRCWSTISSASTGRAPSSASSPTRRPASASRSACECSCAASMPSAAWWRPASASASCRKPPPARTARTTAIAAVDLEDPWAARDLTLCIRSLKDLPPSARQLVEHLRKEA